MQNKHDIRNQHRNLHQVTYILSKNIFHQKFARTPPQPLFTQFRPVVSHRSNFDEKYFLIKYMLLDADSDADSEYHVYFA